MGKYKLIYKEDDGVPLAHLGMSRQAVDQLFRRIGTLDPKTRMAQQAEERNKFLLTIIHYQGIEEYYKQQCAMMLEEIAALKEEIQRLKEDTE